MGIEVDEELQGHMLLRMLGLSQVMHQIMLYVSQGEIKIGRLIEALWKRDRGVLTEASEGTFAVYDGESSDYGDGDHELEDQFVALGSEGEDDDDDEISSEYEQALISERESGLGDFITEVARVAISCPEVP